MLGLGLLFFFFNDTATTEIYTLSLHDALPICGFHFGIDAWFVRNPELFGAVHSTTTFAWWEWKCSIRSEEHTSELQSQSNIVCRLLLEKKKPQSTIISCITSATAMKLDNDPLH